MSIKLSYDICKTVESVHVNFINKSKKLKELQDEIKSLKNISQPFKISCINTLDEQQNRIKMQVEDTQNKINKNKQAINVIDTKLKEKYNNKEIVYNLIINQNNISMNTDKTIKDCLLANIEKGIKELNQQKETIKIRLNKNKSILADLNNKLDFLLYPNKETLNFLFYTEVFPNRIERESIPKQKINIDCIKNMINIHEKGLFISQESKRKISTYKEFLKK
ncbi:hypothetical protein [Proteus mirabilis]|uniref:hypothetical protein n=1 Tax=Proteus mirabilis TaxID=584 RepID=UPI0034D430C8